MAEVSSALADLDRDRSRPAGRVRISLHRAAAFHLVLPRLKAFDEAYPEVRVELVIDDGLVDIVRGGFDAGIRREPALEPDMISVRLDQGEGLMMVASPNYLKAHGRPQTPEDLARHRCLNYRFASGRIYDWRFERDGLVSTMATPLGLVTNDMDMLCAGALEGLGISLRRRTISPPAA
ncbi:hypothetical protein LTR94_030561 [Friedmanniomyces endolithicus]|nr:hypothetical protein LTR94_030561 [Friedmanniomyces endolithicus]